VILVVAFSLFAWAPLLTPVYFLKAHDAAHSVFFLTEFHQGIQDGYLYPRWGPDHGLGYGYPTFVFYAPLPYYVAEVFHLLGAGPTAAIKITYALAFILSGLTMYAFVKRLWGPKAGLVSAVIYTYVPYRLVDTYVRCAFYESCAFVFFPLILLLFLELVETGQRRYLALAGLAYAGLILTHIVTAFLFTPLLMVYVLWLVLRQARQNLWQWLRLSSLSLAAAVLGLGLSAVFLLPIPVERNFIAQEQWTRATYSYDQHFVYPFQLLSAFWDYGYAVEGPQDTMSLQLGLVAVALALVATVLALRRRTSEQRTQRGTVLFFLGLTLVIIMAMLPLALPLWRLLPVAALVQFPWRLLALTSFTLSVLTGTVVPGAEGERGRDSATNPGLYVLLLVVIWASFGYTLPEYTELSPRLETPAAPLDFELAHPDMVSMVAYTQEQPRSTPLVAQYLAGEPLVKAHTLTAGATVEMVRHGGGSEEIIVRSSQEATIQFYTYYFPGWRGYVDGQEVPIRPEDPYGLITLDVPAGEHQVKIRFGDTPIRVIGKVISVLSFGFSLFLLRDDLRRALSRGKSGTIAPHREGSE
jgi:4-amino-4-deoxy-L-arabinose transferase-like glycosyltransferase